ncbi:MAG: hypothetical protein U9M95_06095 [Candidatus Altiarchaeota archaeon]|nr:hypothetical protein [Candidatus Altiarchaeota archaeon]
MKAHGGMLSMQGHVVKLFKHNVRVFIFASKDHGMNWEYVATLLDNKDATEYNADYFTGASIAEQNGRVFLLVSPEKITKYPFDTHKGTVIYEFEDLKTGRLKRDVDGKLVVVKRLATATSTGGQSDFDQKNTYGSIVMDHKNIQGAPEFWQIYNTKQQIV